MDIYVDLTIIDEAMATASVGEDASGENDDTECLRVQEEPTLTQMVEEGLELLRGRHREQIMAHLQDFRPLQPSQIDDWCRDE